MTAAPSARRGVYIGVQMAKNALAPALIPLKRNRGLGLDGDPGAVAEALADLSPALAAVRPHVEGARVLELGPGKTPEILLALILAGAAHGLGVDTRLSIPPGWHDPARLDRLLAALCADAGAPFREALGVGAATLADRAARLRRGHWPLGFHEYDGARLPLHDGSIDLVISKSVLEHVPRGAVRDLLVELHRVVRPGGVMVHAVDLRDHQHIRSDRRVAGDWLDALTYPEPIFDAMFSNRSNYINRFRADDWQTMIVEARWRPVAWTERRWPFATTHTRERLRPPWRTRSEDVLQVGFIWFAAVAS